jgi:hypothetical protein
MVGKTEARKSEVNIVVSVKDLRRVCYNRSGIDQAIRFQKNAMEDCSWVLFPFALILLLAFPMESFTPYF